MVPSLSLSSLSTRNTFILSSHSFAASRPIRSRNVLASGISAVISLVGLMDLRLGGGTLGLFGFRTTLLWRKATWRRRQRKGCVSTNSLGQ
jgi:hypothetical protein